MAGKNLLVNGKNNITARANAMANIQNDLQNKNTASNMQTVTTPNLPRTSALSGLQKAQQPVQTRLDTVNQTLPTNNTPIIQANTGVGSVAQTPTQSRFVGFQQRQGQTMPQWRSPAFVQTDVQRAEMQNRETQQLNNESANLIRQLHRAIKNNNGPLDANQISKQFKQWKGKENQVLQLENEIRPLIQQGQYGNMSDIQKYYPELLQTKGLQNIEDVKAKSELANTNFQQLNKRVDTALKSNWDTFSANGMKYLQDFNILSKAVEQAKKQYRVVGGANDFEIMKELVNQNPELQKIFKEWTSLELSDLDKAKLGRSDAKLLSSIGAETMNSIRNDLGLVADEQVSNEELETGIRAREKLEAEFGEQTWKKVATEIGVPLDSLEKFVYRTYKDVQNKILEQGSEFGKDYAIKTLKSVFKDGLGVNLTDEQAQSVENLYNTAVQPSINQEIQKNQQYVLDYAESVNKDYENRKARNLDPDIEQFYNNRGMTSMLLNGDLKGFAYKAAGETAQNIEMPLIIAAGVVAPEIVLPLMSMDSYSRESQESFEELMEAGANYEQAQEGAAIVGVVSSAVEVGLEKLLGGVETTASKAIHDIFMKDFTKKATEMVAERGLVDILKQGAVTQFRSSLEEGLEEIVQQGIHNKAIQKYDPDQKITEGMLEAFEGGFFNPMNLLAGGGEVYGGIQQNSENIKQTFNNNLDNIKNVTNKVTTNVSNTAKEGYNKAKNLANRIELAPGKVGEVYDTMKNKVTSQGKTNKLTNQQQAEGVNTTSENQNNINGDNYNQKNKNSKTLNKIQLGTLKSYNKMNPVKITEFQDKFGVDYGQAMADMGYTESRETNVPKMDEDIKEIYNEKKKAMNSVEGEFQDRSLADMLEILLQKAKNTKDYDMIDKYERLTEKHNTKGLTMAEANDMREDFSYKIKTKWGGDGNSDKIDLADNVYTAVRKFLEKTAEANGIKDLQKMNRDIAMRKYLSTWIGDKAERQSANNMMSINDWIMFAEAAANPQALALFAGKKILEQTPVKNAVLNAVVGRRENRAIDKQNRQAANKERMDRIESANEGKKLQEQLSIPETPALPNGIRLTKVTEINNPKNKVTSKKKTTKNKKSDSSSSDDTTPPSGGTPTGTNPTNNGGSTTQTTTKVNREDKADLKLRKEIAKKLENTNLDLEKRPLSKLGIEHINKDDDGVWGYIFSEMAGVLAPTNRAYEIGSQILKDLGIDDGGVYKEYTEALPTYKTETKNKVTAKKTEAIQPKAENKIEKPKKKLTKKEEKEARSRGIAVPDGVLIYTNSEFKYIPSLQQGLIRLTKEEGKAKFKEQFDDALENGLEITVLTDEQTGETISYNPYRTNDQIREIQEARDEKPYDAVTSEIVNKEDVEDYEIHNGELRINLDPEKSNGSSTVIIDLQDFLNYSFLKDYVKGEKNKGTSTSKNKITNNTTALWDTFEDIDKDTLKILADMGDKAAIKLYEEEGGIQNMLAEEMYNEESAPDLALEEMYKEQLIEENETPQKPSLFEEDLIESNLKNLDENETPQADEEEFNTRPAKPKNILTKEKGDFKGLSQDDRKNILKSGTVLTVNFGGNTAPQIYQIEKVDGDEIIIRQLDKRTIKARVKTDMELMNPNFDRAESVTYDNSMSKKLADSDLPIIDLLQQKEWRKQTNAAIEEFKKLGLKEGDYLKWKSGEVYKITGFDGDKIKYENAKTGEQGSDFIDNFANRYKEGIITVGDKSDFDAIRKAEDEKIKEEQERKEKEAKREEEKLAPIKDYLGTITNKSQHTKAKDHLLSIHVWTDINGGEKFGTRAKMLNSLMEEGYKLDTEENGVYPNGTPRIKYKFVSPDGRTYFDMNKTDYDYVDYELTKKDDAEIKNNDYSQNLIPDEKHYTFNDVKNASIDSMLITDGFKKYTFEEDGEKREGYAGYLNGKAVNIIPNKADDTVIIEVGDELFRDPDTKDINVQLKDSDEIIHMVAPYDDAGFMSVLAKALRTEQPKLGKPKEIIYKKGEGVFEVYDDIGTLRMNSAVGDKLIDKNGKIYDLGEFNTTRQENGKLYYNNTDSRDYFADKDIIGINKQGKIYDGKEAQERVINDMEDLSELRNILKEKPTSYEGELGGTPVKVEALNVNYNRLNVNDLKDKAGFDSVSRYELQVGNNPSNAEIYETFDELKSALKSVLNGEDIKAPKTKTEVTGEKNAVTAKKVEENKPKNLVTSKEAPKQDIQVVDKDKYYDDIARNTKQHPREMFLYQDGRYFYPKYILPSGQVISPENTYWGEVPSEEAAREWLKREAEEYSEENEAKKTAKLQEMIGKTAEKYEQTLKRIESDNPMQEIWTSGDYFKYGMGDRQMAKAKKEAEVNAEIGTFKKDVIDGKEGYRVFIASTKKDGIWAFYDPKTGKIYKIYKGNVLDDSRPYTTSQVDRIEKFLGNVEKQLDKETKKEKVEKKDVITQEWLDSLKPDKDGVIELDPKGGERYALAHGEGTLVKEGKADGKYLYNYATESRPQYRTIYIKDGKVYDSMKGINGESMTTKQDAIDWLNEKEKDVAHEGTPRYEKTDYETLPKTVSVESEAEKAGPKRIAPDRVKWQQETYDKGLENVKDVIKAKRIVVSDLGFKSLRGKAINDIWEEIQRIRKLPESEADKQYTELARGIYEGLVIKDISKGYRYPEDVTSKFPKAQMQKAIDARARYEKGLFTSFSGKDTRANNQYRDEIGAGIKSQDGKPVTQEQMNEIVDGIRTYGDIFGIDMKKFAEDNNIIYVHLHGGNPFLMGGMNIAGLYRRGADGNISVSLGGKEGVMEKGEDGEMKKTDIKTTTSHELTHAVDGMMGGKLFSSQDIEILKKTMNKPTHLINYYNRSHEIVARAVEQYVANKLGKTYYRTVIEDIDMNKGSVKLADKEYNYIDREGYWDQENFDKYVKPIVEKNMKEKLGDYMTGQPKKNVLSNGKNNVTSGKTQAAKSYSPTIVMRLDENGNPIKKKTKNLVGNEKNKVTTNAEAVRNPIIRASGDPTVQIGNAKIKQSTKVKADMYIQQYHPNTPGADILEQIDYLNSNVRGKRRKGTTRTREDNIGYRIKDDIILNDVYENGYVVIDNGEDDTGYTTISSTGKLIERHVGHRVYNILKSKGLLR